MNTSTPKRLKSFHSRNFCSSLRPLKLRSSKVGKSFGAHATSLCGRLLFDTPRRGSGCCEAPCKEQFHGQVIRTLHDEYLVEGPSHLKNRAKPITAFACCLHDEQSILVIRHLHGRQHVQATHSYVHVPELPAQRYSFLRSRHPKFALVDFRTDTLLLVHYAGDGDRSLSGLATGERGPNCCGSRARHRGLSWNPYPNTPIDL